MNLTDIPTYVADVMLGHPDAVAAGLTGAAVGLGLGVWLTRRAFRNVGREEIAGLRAELDALRRTESKSRKLQVELALVRQQVKAVAKRAVKFRSWGKEYQRRWRAEAAARAADAQRHQEVAGELTAALDDARTRLADQEPRPDGQPAPVAQPGAAGNA